VSTSASAASRRIKPTLETRFHNDYEWWKREVHKIDALQRALKEASQQDDFITPRTSLVDAVFRVFLANQNKPLTPIELGERIGRPPMTILRTLTGSNVYKGLRPVIEERK
jgi:hypothetical protein